MSVPACRHCGEQVYWWERFSVWVHGFGWNPHPADPGVSVNLARLRQLEGPYEAVP